MRPLVAPPPTTHCNRCGGELRLKQVELADREIGKQFEVFVCTTCGREQTFAVTPDPYVVSAAYRSLRGR